MSLLITKFIENNAVIGSKIRLNFNETLRSLNQAGNADIDLLKLTTGNVLEFQTLPAVAAALPFPSLDEHLVTLGFVKNFIEGKTDAKGSVAYLAVTNVAGTFTPGSGSNPATLVQAAASLVIDGKTFTGADVNVTYPLRIGLIGQTDPIQNGVFDLTAAGATSFTLTRSSDFDGIYNAGGNEVTSGAWFRVTKGTELSGYEVQLTTDDPIVIDTTELIFVAYPTSLNMTGGDMIVKNGNDFAIDLANNGGLESTNPGNAAGQLRVKTATASLENIRTVQIDASGNVVAKRQFQESFTLGSTDITNGYVDLARVAGLNSVKLVYPGAPEQVENLDFTVNSTGGSGSKTRVTFAGGLAAAGASALAAGETIYIAYEAFGP